MLVSEVPHHWDTDGVGDRHGELGEPPCPGKVPCADLLVDVHLEAVTVAPVEDAVDPHEDDVPVVAMHRAQGHHRDPGEEEGDLAEVLPGYLALFGMDGDDGAEDAAAQGPGQAQEGLQEEERCPPDSSRKGLLGLQRMIGKKCDVLMKF